MKGEGLHVSIAPYHIGELWGLPITPTLLTTSFVAVLLVTAAFFIGRNIKIVPGKGQVAVEGVLYGVYGYVLSVLEDEKLAKRFFPLIVTIFLYIAIANLFGLLPFVGSIGVHGGTGHGGFTPLFYPPSSDLNFPLALAFVAFLAIEFAGIAALGFLKYAHKFVNFSSVIGFVVGIIELISEVARLVTFSFRLFGNIFAGKVLLLVALYFIPFLLPVPLVLYETLVGIIQGAIFALLTLFFIKIAATPHEAH